MPRRPNADDKPGIVNADQPSDSLGEPGIGTEASGAHFLRDTVDSADDEPQPDGKNRRSRPPEISSES